MFWQSSVGKVDPGLIQVVFDLDGPLDRYRFERAWMQVIQRHEAMRMSLHTSDQKVTRIIVWRQANLALEWKEAPEVDFELHFEESKRQDRQRGLDLGQPPAMRLQVIRRTDASHRVLWTCHHLLLDGWSTSLILKDVLDAYATATNQSPAWPVLRCRQKDLLQYLGDRDESAARQYWRQEMAEFQPVRMLTQSGQPVPTLNSDYEHLVLTGDENVSSVITESMSQMQLTPNAVIRAAWSQLLSALTDRDDISFSATVSARPPQLAGIESLTGMLSNVVPVRNRMNVTQTVVEWLHQVRDQQFEMQPFEDVSLAEIQQWCELPGSVLSFESLLVVENFPIPETKVGGLSIRNYQSDITTNLPLNLCVIPGREWTIKVIYDRHLIDSRTAGSLAKLFLLSVQRLVTSGDNETVQSVTDWLRGQDEFAAIAPNFRQRKDEESVSVVSGIDASMKVMPRTENEMQITRIWESVLGISPIGIHSNFFELGGRSISAVRIMGELENATGVRLSPTVLLEQPTVALLSKLVNQTDDLTPEPSSKVLVRLRPGKSDQRPVICVHVGGGHVFYYRFLANHVDPQRPVVGLQPVGLEGEPPLESIDAIVDCYLEALQAIDLSGPIDLIGYCMGGIVCQEMARRLVQDGCTVNSITVLDSGVPRDRRRRSIRQFVAQDGIAKLVPNFLPMPGSGYVVDSKTHLNLDEGNEYYNSGMPNNGAVFFEKSLKMPANTPFFLSNRNLRIFQSH